MRDYEQLGPGITARVVNGDAEIHVDLPAFAEHLGIPESEAESHIEEACRKALESIYGPDAHSIPITTRYDA